MSNATENSKSFHTGLKQPEEKYLGAGSSQAEPGRPGGLPTEADLRETSDTHPGSISDGVSPEADEGDAKPAAPRSAAADAKVPSPAGDRLQRP